VSAADVRYEGATRYYAKAGAPALDGLDLEIAEGEFMVLVGPSGSGKSTALRMLAGLEGVDGGRILIGGVDVTTTPPRDRDIAMVFQDYALYPHMTVAENIGFHLKIAKRPREEIRSRVAEAAELLGLGEYLQRRPAELSGGQRQRVAMGRAIIRKPKVFLMDEPLSNLDAKLRVQTRNEIARLQRRLGVTTIYVTHDQVEAMTMGDRVAVLDRGRLQQCDRPRTLFDRPANTFVAGFMGSPGMALLPAVVDADAGAARLRDAVVPLTAAQRAAASGTAVTIGLRPEGVSFAAGEEGLSGIVDVVEELGADSYAYVTVELDDGPVTIAVREPASGGAAPGSRVRLRLDHDALHLFDGATGLRLPDAVAAAEAAR
jgi:multiple sugar transport system ATP-binding protein